MRARAALWFGFAWLVAPLCLLGLALYLQATPASGSGYVLDAQVRVLSGTPLVLPAVCLGAALTGARVRQSGLLRGLRLQRPLLRVLAGLAAPSALAGAAVLLAVMVTESGALAAPWRMAWEPVAAAILGAVAYAWLGVGLGTALRPVLAIPLALALPYVLIGFPPGMDPLWLRHLTGFTTDCCAIHEQLSGRAVVAGLLTSVALAGAGAALFAHSGPPVRERRALALGGALTGTLTLAGAVVAAQPLGYSPAAPRSSAPVCRAADGVGIRVCLWPEHEEARGQVEDTLRQAQEVSARTGVRLPEAVVEGDPLMLRWPEVPFTADPSGDARATARRLAAVLSEPGACGPALVAGGIAEAAEQVDASTELAAVAPAWWRERLGLPPAPSEPASPAQASPEASAARSELGSLPERRQGAWINERLDAALAACRQASGPGRAP